MVSPILPVGELARRCADEMSKFRRRAAYDPQYCHELFRQALERRSQSAWSAIYQQYHRLVRRWLGSVPDDADVLVNQVFERFWKALPAERFSGFANLDGLLKYLQRCAHTVAIDAGRKEKRDQARRAALAVLEEPSATWGLRTPSELVLDEIVTEQLHEYIARGLQSQRECIVFRASIQWDMKPRTIAERWPDHFSSSRQVSRIKERIFRRLQRDEDFRIMLGLDGRNSGFGE